MISEHSKCAGHIIRTSGVTEPHSPLPYPFGGLLHLYKDAEAGLGKGGMLLFCFGSILHPLCITINDNKVGDGREAGPRCWPPTAYILNLDITQQSEMQKGTKIRVRDGGGRVRVRLSALSVTK